MKQVLIATGNEGKKKEMLLFFKGLEGFEFLTLKDFDPVEEPVEDGDSFEANAAIKAQYYGEQFGVMTLGEDAGLILSAFPDKFGLRTRRELEAEDDMDWLTQFMDLMDGVEDRKATFYSAMAFYNPETKATETVQGTTDGEITDFPQAPIEKGIPVSAVFMPEGAIDVFSSMTKAEKATVSHRGKAASMMEPILKKG